MPPRIIPTGLARIPNRRRNHEEDRAVRPGRPRRRFP
jgi:hypothetical protein